MRMTSVTTASCEGCRVTRPAGLGRGSRSKMWNTCSKPSPASLDVPKIFLFGSGAEATGKQVGTAVTESMDIGGDGQLPLYAPGKR